MSLKKLSRKLMTQTLRDRKPTAHLRVLELEDRSVPSVSFLPASSFGSGSSGPISTTTGDFNNDGKMDVAVANYQGSTVGVLLGNGSGGFAPAATFNSGGGFARSIATGDFNGDGNLDITVANWFGNVGVLLGNGSGGFSTTSYGTGGSNPHAVSVGDFNGDGIPDIAVANHNSNEIRILSNNGSGLFSLSGSFNSGGSQPDSMTTGDFNGDGKLDIAVTNLNSPNLGVLLGNGNSTFAAATSISTGGTFPRAIVAADFNGDGKLDLAVSNGGTNTVGVLSGNGIGGFAAAVTFASGGSSPFGLTAGDFDRDGILDLAATNAGSDTVSVFSGNGSGSFAAPVTFGSGGTGPQSIAKGDFNGDGRLDLVTTNSGTNSVGILLNSTSLISNSIGLAGSTFFGGTGDQRGTAVTYQGGSVYAAGNTQPENQTSTPNGLIMRYSTPVNNGTAPAWARTFDFGTSLFGISATTNGVFPVGQNYSLSSDGVGGKEVKGIALRFNADGTNGAGTGGSVWYNTPNFYTYTGVEAFATSLIANVGGTDYVFAAGSGQPQSYSAAIFAKYDLNGNLLVKTGDPSNPPPNGNFLSRGSNANGIAELNDNIYFVGGSSYGDPGGIGRPTIWKQTGANLSSVWQVKDTSVQGEFRSVTAINGFLYAAGYTFNDSNYLIQKFDQAGNRLWSTNTGGAGIDVLTGVVGLGDRLYASGYTTSSGAGGKDYVILEIDPATGSILSTTVTGGSQDDFANGITTDGVSNLYVVGESRSTAQGGNSIGQNDISLLRFSVSPPNSAPTALSLDNQSLAENSGANAVVGNFSTTDPDIGNTFTYTFATGAGDTNNGLFNIDGNKLQANASFDYEAGNTYSVLIRTTDQGGLSTVQQFTITITDVNETPTNITGGPLSVAENAANTTVVGTMTGVDPDGSAPFNTPAYTLVSNPGGRFAIGLTSGIVTVADGSLLNYEANTSHTIRVRVTDGGTPGLFFEKDFNVAITDVNETPTDITTAGLSVAENAFNGTAVGSVVGVDPDNWAPFNTLTYSLTNDAGGRFAINTTNGAVTVANGSLLNYEVNATHTIRVMVTDGGTPGLSFEKDFTVTINNIEEVPPILALARANNTVEWINGSGKVVFTTPAISSTFGAITIAAIPDRTGDNVPDLIVGSGFGVPSRLGLVNGATGAVLWSTQPYGNFTGGVNVAVGDITGDGKLDFITGAGTGGGPHVKVFDGVSQTMVRSFFAYAASFTGGVNVASGDVNRDGRADIVTAPGRGGGPDVRIFSGLSNPPIINGISVAPTFTNFNAYASNYYGGVSVSVADMNGDGYADIMTGALGGSQVRVFSGANYSMLLDFSTTSGGQGVQVAFRSFVEDGPVQLVTLTTTTSSLLLTAYDTSLAKLFSNGYSPASNLNPPRRIG